MSNYKFSVGNQNGPGYDIVFTKPQIIGAVSIFLAVLGGVAFGGYQWFQKYQEDKIAQKQEASAPEEVEKETYAIPLSEVQKPAVPVAITPNAAMPVAQTSPVGQSPLTVLPPVPLPAPTVQETAPVEEAAEIRKEAPGSGEAVKEKTAQVSAASAQRTAELVSPRSPFSENKPIHTSLPPLPAPGRSDTPVEAPSRKNPPAPTVSDATPAAPASTIAEPPVAPATPAATVPAQTPLLTPVDPEEEPVDVVVASAPATPAAPVAQPVPEKKPASTAPSTPAPAPAASGRGKYGVQLAAFSGNERQSKAETLQRNVREKAGLTAEIESTASKDIYKVVVVGFQDRDAAAKAIPTLKQKLGLSEAFVKPL
jgi:hypothetical protein